VKMYHNQGSTTKLLNILNFEQVLSGTELQGSSPLVFSPTNLVAQQNTKNSLFSRRDLLLLLLTMTSFKEDPEVTRETEFLIHVVRGEQRQAEKMLKKERHLALASGTVTDHADRTFYNITGFQYAVWALDWHMWSMIQKYLPEEAAQFQAQGFTTGPWVEQQGVQANWQNLLDAYEYYLVNYSKLYNASKWTELHNIWLIQIGGGQRKLPMHVFHEYCHPDRSFDPVPDFKGPLPRSLPYWFSLDSIGSSYCIFRCAAFQPKMWSGTMHKPVAKAMYHYTCDWNALTQLASTRSEQREKLVAELVNSDEK